MYSLFRQSTKSTSRLIGFLFSVLSYVLLIQNGLNIGWSPTFKIILDTYVVLKDALLSTFQIAKFAIFLTNLASRLFQLQITLMPHWSDIFILLSLYFGARAKSYWDTGAREHAIFRMALGVLFAFVTSVASGLSQGNGLIGDVSIAGVTFVGIFFYELVTSALGGWRYRKPDQTWVEEFFRYLGFSLPTTGIAIVIFIAAIVFEAHQPTGKPVNIGISALLVYSIILTFYWAIRGWFFAGNPKNREIGETQLNRFRRSSAARISFLMGGNILAAVFFVLTGAGLSTFDP